MATDNRYAIRGAKPVMDLKYELIRHPAIRAVGLILLGFGVLQVGLSLQNHDPFQQPNGMLTIAGGIVIIFTREIITR